MLPENPFPHPLISTHTAHQVMPNASLIGFLGNDILEYCATETIGETMEICDEILVTDYVNPFKAWDFVHERCALATCSSCCLLINTKAGLIGYEYMAITSLVNESTSARKLPNPRLDDYLINAAL